MIQETEPDESTRCDYSRIVSMINYDHPLSRPLAIQQHIEGPKWLTLASPNLYVASPLHPHFDRAHVS